MEHPNAASRHFDGASMRSISFSVTALLALLSSAALARQPSGTKDETIGHPPPLPGPPSNSEPSSTTQAAPADSTPRASNPAPKGYTGAYAPAGTPPTRYSTVHCRRRTVVQAGT